MAGKTFTTMICRNWFWKWD